VNGNVEEGGDGFPPVKFSTTKTGPSASGQAVPQTKRTVVFVAKWAVELFEGAVSAVLYSVIVAQ
jgi:hypothetical protein